jgi:FkbM family methyltransferase
VMALRRAWHLRRAWQLAAVAGCAPLARVIVLVKAAHLAASDLVGRSGRPRRFALGDLGVIELHDFSELLVLWEVFVAGVYDVPDLPREARLVVDLGCNIGASLLWLHRRYPTARIVGYEADPRTAALARRNATSWAGVEVHAAAVADRDGELAFWRHPGQSWASGMLPADGTPISVRAVSLDSVLDGLDAPVDVLKIDIEGAEHATLAAATRLDRVRCVIGEYHDVPDGSWETLRSSLRDFPDVTVRPDTHCFVALRDLDGLQP